MVETVAIIVTAVGVLLAGVSLRGAQLQRNRQFESLYVQRYWSLMDRLSYEAGKRAPYETLGENDKKTLQQYLRLCEDQIEMRALGAITRSTYIIWATGMKGELQREPVKGAFAEAQQDNTHPLVHLRALAQSDDFDPDERSRIVRWLEGVK